MDYHAERSADAPCPLARRPQLKTFRARRPATDGPGQTLLIRRPAGMSTVKRVTFLLLFALALYTCAHAQTQRRTRAASSAAASKPNVPDRTHSDAAARMAQTL